MALASALKLLSVNRWLTAAQSGRHGMEALPIGLDVRAWRRSEAIVCENKVMYEAWVKIPGGVTCCPGERKRNIQSVSSLMMFERCLQSWECVCGRHAGVRHNPLWGMGRQVLAGCAVYGRRVKRPCQLIGCSIPKLSESLEECVTCRYPVSLCISKAHLVCWGRGP